MVKGSRPYRRFYKVPKKTFNYIASNYLKYKVKAYFQVRAKQELSGNVSITFQQILEKAPDFPAIAKNFLLYKVTGVNLDVAPIPTSSLNMPACGFSVSILQTGDDAGMLTVAQSPNSLNLGLDHCHKYVKTYSAWTPTTENALPSLKIVTNTSGVPNTGEITYNYIITCYLLFKAAA